jgi:hypothetical protein
MKGLLLGLVLFFGVQIAEAQSGLVLPNGIKIPEV